MAYTNLYSNRGYVNPYYTTNYPQNYMGYQNSMVQQSPIQQPQLQPIIEQPIHEIRFLTADEIKAYIVMPNTKVMLIDKINKLAYIKSADAMGQSSCDIYSFDTFNPDKSEEKIITPAIDVDSLVKKNEIENFVSKNELKEIADKIDKIQKQIKINEILKGAENNG